MLIQNCQQLLWRNPWFLWSPHPTECPNFDTVRRTMAAAIYTSCGRKGFPHAQTPPTTTTPYSFSQATPSLSTELGESYHIIKGRPTPSCLSVCFMLLFSPSCHIHAVFRYNRVTVRGAKPMHLLQFSHSIDSLAKIYVFSARPPAAALAASLTGGSWWHQSAGDRCPMIPSDASLLAKAISVRTSWI